MASDVEQDLEFLEIPEELKVIIIITIIKDDGLVYYVIPPRNFVRRE
jgi:hypothetical protein